MVADQPLVVYPKNKDSEKKVTSKSMDDFYERWKAKKDAQKSVIRKGEKISLDDYLRNGI